MLCLPRVCGDEPCDLVNLIQATNVCPAYAGMNRN